MHKRQRKVKKLKLAAENRGVALCKVIADQEESAGLSGEVQVQASKAQAKTGRKSTMTLVLKSECLLLS